MSLCTKRQDILAKENQSEQKVTGSSVSGFGWDGSP